MTRIAKNPLVQRFVHWMSTPLSPWLVALGLLVIGALAYGVHIPTWGLYGDDWIYLYSYHAAGAGSFIDFVRADRPFSFWIYTLITPILGESIWAYHLLLLLVRWAGALLLIWVIQLISPRHRHLAVAAAVLFLVYPGFGQQPVALQFILHFTVLALTIFSFAAMIKGAGDERPWLWRALSWFSALVSLFSLEYFVGYELMRPVVLWIVYGRTGDSLRARIRRVGASWLPFVLIGGVFAAWRVLIFKFPFYQPETLTMIRQSPAAGISALLARLLADLKVVLYDAWRQTLTLPSGDRSGYLLLAGLAFLVMFLLMKRTVRATTARSGGFAFVWFSLLLLLVGGIPFWVTDIPVALSFPWDRATLPFMLGAALFTSGMLEWLLRPVFLPYALALLVALAVGYHSLNAAVYAGEWRAMRDYFWQMTWRAPDMKDGAIILSDDIPLFKHSDNDLTPVVNWTYRPHTTGDRYTYQYFDLSTRVELPIPSYQPGLSVVKGYRSFRFEGSTDALLALYWRPPGCLHVVSAGQVPYDDLPQTILDVLPFSNIDLISPGNATPPWLFGDEPAHTWCYFFQKAELARQNHDWDEINRLGDEAEAGGWQASQPAEYLPFLEAAARAGNLQDVRRWHERIMNTAGDAGAICAFWLRAGADEPLVPAMQELAAQASTDLGCGQ